MRRLGEVPEFRLVLDLRYEDSDRHAPARIDGTREWLLVACERSAVRPAAPLAVDWFYGAQQPTQGP